MTPHSMRNVITKQCGISFHVYELLKLCLKQVLQVSAVALHDHRQPDVLEVINGLVDYRDGDLLHLLFDGVLELLAGVRLAPVHPVLQVPPEHEVRARQVE